MTVNAPGPVAATAALAKLALPLPQAAAASPVARAVDHVDLSPPPTMRALWELAFAGSQHLDTLLPTLDRMIQGPEPIPFAVGHLARAVGDAAHQVDAGSADLAARNDPARPSPEALEGWRQAARSALHDASGVLARADDRMAPLARQADPEVLWAMAQIEAAQRQVGSTIGNFRFARRREPLPVAPRSRWPSLSSAAALLGVLILVSLYATAAGLWLAGAGLIGLGLGLAWAWRVVVFARNLRIELRE